MGWDWLGDIEKERELYLTLGLGFEQTERGAIPKGAGFGERRTGERERERVVEAGFGRENLSPSPAPTNPQR